MDPVQARLVSRNPRKGTAEVVVLVGGRSVTRHLVRVVGNRGIGRNIDDAAIARLDAAEVAEKKALEAYRRAIARSAEVGFIFVAEIQEAVADAAADAADAAAAYAATEKVRAEVPCTCEFVFA